MAPMLRTTRRRRGFFGLLLKYLFIVFNLAMLAWLISYWMTIGPKLSSLSGDAARLGGSIGATVGTGVIVGFWVAGAVVPGLFVLLTTPRS